MNINCPNCSTQFSVPETALGESGKTLKCAKCGHKWFQPAPRTAAAEAEPAPAMAGGEDLPPPEPDAETEPAADDAPDSSADEGSEVEADDAEAARQAGDEDHFDLDGGEDQGEEDAKDAEEAEAGASGPAPAAPDLPSPPPPPAGRGSLLDDGGDFLDFEDEDEEERALVAAAAEAAAEEGRRQEEAGDDDRPEPIAFKFPRAADREPQSGRGGLVVWSLVALLALSGAVFSAYAFRMQLVAALPAAAPVYEALGIEARPVGAGLAIRNVMPERRRTADGDILILRGVVANTTDQPLRVPSLQVSIYRGSQLSQRKVVSPPREELAPGETVSFNLTVQAADPLADQVTVSFATPGETPSA